MKEKPVLVVGATSGIGRSVTERLVASRIPVVAAGRDAGRLDELQRASADPSLLTTVTIDATDETAVDSGLAWIQASAGGLAGLVNCVGSVLLKPVHLTSAAEFDHTFSVNVRSCFLLLRRAVPLFADSGGSVVFFSTAAARAGISNHDVIAAAKSAVEGLVRASAASYAAKNIRINAIAPGLVRTPLTVRIHGNPTAAEASISKHALGRFGEPQEIASLVCWLLSAEASWCTGQTIAFDGGLSLRSR